MHDVMFSTSLPATPPPVALQDRASPDTQTVIVVAGDRFALNGIAGMLGRIHSIASVEMYDSIDTAMSGPAASLVVMHNGTPALTTARVMNLIKRRQAGALLAAGLCGPDGLMVLRAAGARGLLTGMETPELCASLIQLALAGCCCWPAAAAIDPDESKVLHSMPDPALILTPRQRDVAALLTRGHSNKIIAAILGMSEGTVKIHLTAVFRTLGVSNRAMAVARLLPHFGSSTFMDCAVEEWGERS